jgi:hypothetical protein
MDSIAKNVRFDMHLILIASVLVAFPLLHSAPDIVGSGVTIANQIVSLSHSWRGDLFEVFDPETRLQLQQYHRGVHSEDAPLTPEGQRLSVGAMRVDHLLKLRSLLTPRALSQQDVVIPTEGEYLVDLEILRGFLSQINEVYQETIFPESATFDQLAEAVRGRVTVPVVGRIAYVEDAVPIIAVALGVVFLHLISLIKALKAAVERGAEAGGFELVWFHPGWLGVTLGVLWLEAPSMVVGFSVIRDVIPSSIGLPVALALFALGLYAAVNLMAVRRQLLERLATGGQKKEQGSGLDI